ncbi:proteoglycan 4-like [Myripristis murdjan]|uniref:proteoglycan 4-like n=1 Tax=Myripristis murdjan TaxID=586833 RepID=UPI001175D995|nr:proteoglycan 4-like [Myripristis murdjan]
MAVTNQRPHPDQKSIIKPGSKADQKPATELELNQKSITDHGPGIEKSPILNLGPKHDQEPFPESEANIDREPLPDEQLTSVQDPTPGQKLQPHHAPMTPYQRPKPNQKTTKTNQRPHPDKKLTIKPGPKPDQIPITDPNLGKISKLDQKHPRFPTNQKTRPDVKPQLKQDPAFDQEPKTDGMHTPTRPDQMSKLNPKPISGKNVEPVSNKKTKPGPPLKHWQPTRPRTKPGISPAMKPRPAGKPKQSPNVKAYSDSSPINRATSDSIQNSQTDMPPTSSPVKKITELNLSQEDRVLRTNTMKTITLGPKTSTSPFLEVRLFPHLRTVTRGFTAHPTSRIMSDPSPQTSSQAPSITRITRPTKRPLDILHPSIIPHISPGSTTPKSPGTNSGSSLQAKIIPSLQETAPSYTAKPDKVTVLSHGPKHKLGRQTISTLKPHLISDLRSTTPATSTPEPLIPNPFLDSTTPSARELRVKINQVAAFLNNSPNGGPQDRHLKSHPKEDHEGNEEGSKADRIHSQIPALQSSKATMRRDCSDLLIRGEKKSGVYQVTPDLHHGTFPVLCDMETKGGGWTVLQRRQDGSVSFNRGWAEYRSGFGELNGGEFWLGNDQIHVLTRDRDMILRVDLEDFNGLKAYAEYGHFRVASERQRYRLAVGSYSGSAGDALHFSIRYDHNNRAFTTPDRDHDRYPSGNCGAYYSSGWWFDACMAANLNGKYYAGKYKGIRDGIFWGTWHNISTEYYPTSDRQSFKTVQMMIRPKGFAP